MNQEQDLMKRFNLPNYIRGKSFAEASKIINGKFEDRSDKASLKTKNDLLQRLADAQEYLKSQQQPNPQEQMMQQQQVGMQQQPMPQQQSGDEQIMNPQQQLSSQPIPQFQMAYGGFSGVDPTDPPVKGGVKNRMGRYGMGQIYQGRPEAYGNPFPVGSDKYRAIIQYNKIGESRQHLPHERARFDELMRNDSRMNDYGGGSNQYALGSYVDALANPELNNQPMSSRPPVQAIGGGLKPAGLQPMSKGIGESVPPLASTNPIGGGDAPGGGIGVGAITGAVSSAASLAQPFMTPKKNEEGAPASAGSQAASGALSGAGKGAAIGSVIPGVGTAIGAGAGALVGGIGGFVKGKREKKEFLNDKKEEVHAGRAQVLNTYATGGYEDTPPDITKMRGQVQIPSPRGYDVNTGFEGVVNQNKPIGIKQPSWLNRTLNTARHAVDDGYEAVSDGLSDAYNASKPVVKRGLKKTGKFLDDNKYDIMRGVSPAINLAQYLNMKQAPDERLDRLDARYKPSYTDEAQLENTTREQFNNSAQALASASGGSSSALRSNILGAQLNRTKALSAAQAQASAMNRQQDQFGQQFNVNVDKTNLQQSNFEKDINARNKGQYETEKSKALSRIGTDFGDIGKEGKQKDIIERITGYNQKGEKIGRKKPKAKSFSNNVKGRNGTVKSVGKLDLKPVGLTDNSNHFKNKDVDQKEPKFKTRGEAFKYYHKKLGEGKTFPYKGKKYSTNTKK